MVGGNEVVVLEGWASFNRDLLVAASFAVLVTGIFAAEALNALPPGRLSAAGSEGYAEASFVAAIAASAAVLGVVLAGVAVVIAFVHPTDLAEAYVQDEASFGRYLSVFFTPAKVAVITIPVALIGRGAAYAVAGNAVEVVIVTLPSLLVLAYQLTSLWQSIAQVRGALLTVARHPEAEAARSDEKSQN